MRTHRIWIPAALLLLAQTFGAGCLLAPQLKDKAVDLVTSGEVVTTFVALGTINTFDATQTITIRNEFDVAKALDDAGIDVSDVKSITLSGVSYRITKAQAGRTISDGQVTVRWAGGATQPLISTFEADAGAVTGWITPTLNPLGVTVVNQMLAAIVTELHGGAPAADELTYGVSGTSNPLDTNSDFEYQFRLTISIVGTVKTKWLE